MGWGGWQGIEVKITASKEAEKNANLEDHPHGSTSSRTAGEGRGLGGGVYLASTFEFKPPSAAKK
jgi:hypothetical protein